MAQIRINTEYTKDVGRRLTAEGDRLAEIGRELQSAIGSLDTGAWDGRSRSRADPMLSRVRPESDQITQQLDNLGRQLTRVADAFEQADSQSAAGVNTIPWFMPQPLLGWRTNPALRVGPLLAGGGSAAAIALTPLPGPGTESKVSFIERLTGIPVTVAGWLAPAIAAVTGWFGWHDVVPAQPAAPAPLEELHEVEVLEPGKTSEGQPAAPPQPQPKVTAEITTAPLPARSLTPALKQTSGSYECAPTAASMVLDYWHKRDSKHQTRTPQALIQGLDSRFNPKSGINADELVTGLKEMDLGYETIERQALLDQQALQAELENGPVIAQVHLNWGASGYAHMVTVTGMSENGQTVYVNDPWTGEALEKDWSTFERSWSFAGQHSGASHLIVKIRP